MGSPSPPLLSQSLSFLCPGPEVSGSAPLHTLASPQAQSHRANQAWARSFRMLRQTSLTFPIGSLSRVLWYSHGTLTERSAMTSLGCSCRKMLLERTHKLVNGGGGLSQHSTGACMVQICTISIHTQSKTVLAC